MSPLHKFRFVFREIVCSGSGKSMYFTTRFFFLLCSSPVLCYYKCTYVIFSVKGNSLFRINKERKVLYEDFNSEWTCCGSVDRCG